MRVGNRELPAGTTVAPCIHLAHRRPDIWKEPEKFNPWRFLENVILRISSSLSAVASAIASAPRSQLTR